MSQNENSAAAELDIFAEYQKNELAKQQSQSQQSQNTVKDDPRFIRFKPGNTYRIRLLITKGDPERKTPLIHQYIHRYYNKDTKEFASVICPTSEYLDDYRGFKKCPICEKNTEMYRENTDSSMEIYEMFKRQFTGYALAYVINDPVNESNNNTVRIFKYYIGTRKFLKKEILGIDEDANRKNKKKKDDASAPPVPETKAVIDEEPLGRKAFDLVNGYDLIITVGEKGEYNEYTLKFARTPTTIYATPEEISKQASELHFDEDLFKNVTMAELQAFYNKYVNSDKVHMEHVVDGSVASDIVDDLSESAPAPASEPVQKNAAQNVPKPQAGTTAPKAPVNVAPAQPVKNPTAQELDLDNIDAILEELK